MIQLLYISDEAYSLSTKELEALLEQSRAKNKRLGITGMLVYHDGTFMQILEGNQTDVESLFATIEKDGRNQNVILIDKMNVEERSFDAWSMAFRNLCNADLEKYPAIALLESTTESGAAACPIDHLVDSFLDMVVANRINQHRPSG